MRGSNFYNPFFFESVNKNEFDFDSRTRGWTRFLEDNMR